MLQYLHMLQEFVSSTKFPNTHTQIRYHWHKNIICITSIYWLVSMKIGKLICTQFITGLGKITESQRISFVFDKST